MNSGRIVASAVVELQPNPPGSFLLSTIHVNEANRRKGLGTTLMRMITNIADLNGIELWLVVDDIMNGQQSTAMDKQQLFDWYEKWGFQRYTKHSYTMRRLANY